MATDSQTPDSPDEWARAVLAASGRGGLGLTAVRAAWAVFLRMGKRPGRSSYARSWQSTGELAEASGLSDRRNVSAGLAELREAGLLARVGCRLCARLDCKGGERHAQVHEARIPPDPDAPRCPVCKRQGGHDSGCPRS